MQLVELDALIKDVRTVYSAPTDGSSWFISVKTYNNIRWLKYCSEVYPEPHRKLRKCYLRKMYRRRKQDKRRWFS